MIRPLSIECRSELCVCGAHAEHKIQEVILKDDPNPRRAPLVAFLCRWHFGQVMGPSAWDVLVRQAPARPEEKEPEVLPTGRAEITPAAADDRLLVSIPEASRMLGISKSSLWKMISNGELLVVKFGNRTLVQTEVLRQLASGKRPQA